MERTFDVQTPDGRTLHVHEDGAADGPVVVAHHGTPGAGLLYAGWVEAAEQRGLRLIGYDRPGYGGSTRMPGRTVADAAVDVAAILDHLAVERFATWGASGGGPHALACAALLDGRCAGAVTLAGVAPWDAEGLDWLAGQGEDNKQEWAAAQEGLQTLEAFCGHVAEAMQGATTEDLVREMGTLLSPPDAACLTDRLGEYFLANSAHALEPGVGGWADDDLAFLAPWGFDVAAIMVPVLVWQGQHDYMVPPAHGRWLAGNVGNVQFRFSGDDGHITLVERRMGEVLDHFARLI